MKETNRRFWVYVNGDCVKLTLHPDQELRWWVGGLTDEGYHHEHHQWSWHEEGVERYYVSDGKDCDGRLSHSLEGFCPTDQLMWDTCSLSEEVLLPHWEQRRHEVYDENAQAMNY